MKRVYGDAASRRKALERQKVGRSRCLSDKNHSTDVPHFQCGTFHHRVTCIASTHKVHGAASLDARISHLLAHAYISYRACAV